MPLERLWAGWRGEYVDSDPPGGDGCVFCAILDSGEEDDATYVLWRGESTVAILNAFPYTSGHVLVLPYRHVADLEELSDHETIELWATVTTAVVAIKVAYHPGGLNVGSNLGRPAGAGIPGHLHVHCLPRWNGDTNFMTSLAEARVLPEALHTTWRRLRKAWPASPEGS
ncbi:MAG TPA: HIT domain-containing protein [Acidimicrobiales bacterium]|nr:HIT domain-containing protein [Acidimicrobiales bacterium]